MHALITRNFLSAFLFALAISCFFACSPKSVPSQPEQTQSESGQTDEEPYVFSDSLDYSFVPNKFQYSDYVNKESIRTVQFKIKGSQYSYPMIALGTDETLELRFDELGEDWRDYSYRIVQCRSDWSPSEMSDFMYIDGFNSGSMDNYEYAYDTNVPYVSYWLDIPNLDTRITKSGNYLLLIYEGMNEEQVVLTRRFMVYENQWDIPSRIVRPNINRYHRSYQNLDFQVNFGEEFISNPLQEVSVTILQNGRWDNAVQNLRPFFLGADFLQFRFADQALFKAGKEFRYFDTRDLENLNERIIKTYENDKGLEVELIPDEVRAYQPYSFKRDLNGLFFIYKRHKLFESADPNYVRVNFTLNAEKPIEEGNVYVFGAFSDWKALKANQMKYDSAAKAYKGSISLKQGLYNYQYVVAWDEENRLDDTTLEGNYWKTENDYMVLVYHSAFNARYDRLIAVKQINSRY